MRENDRAIVITLLLVSMALSIINLVYFIVID